MLSCSYVESAFQKTPTPVLDTVVDFKSVDTSPSFPACDSLLGAAKTSCFSIVLHQRFSENLAQHSLRSKDSIDTVISIDLLIDTQGVILVKQVHATTKLLELLPTLDSLLRKSVQELPKVYPAIKRGIPVATQYQLPIRIKM